MRTNARPRATLRSRTWRSLRSIFVSSACTACWSRSKVDTSSSARWLAGSGLGKNPKVFGTVGFVLLAIVVCLMHYAGFTYRAYNIHLASLLGTIVAYNVWFKIWPAQQKIIRAVKEGTAPDGALVSMAGTRSRHNVYMSVALFWGMLNTHTTYFSGGNLGISESYAYVVYLVVILLAWHIVWQLYRRAGKVKGF